MPLTEIAIKAIKPSEKITRHYDEKGLYLEVSPAGGRWWRFKYMVAGKEKRLSLGTYPETSLKQARINRDEMRTKIQQGTDPAAERKSKKRIEEGQLSFEQVARRWFETWKIGKTERYAGYAIGRLESDVFPSIGHIGINDVTTRDVVACAKKMEDRGVTDLPRKNLIKISQIYRYAIAHDIAERNPAADFQPSDVLRPIKRKNMARIEQSQLPNLLKSIEQYDGAPITKIALKLMALTFLRTRELTEAPWSEIDGDVWRIPADRMKIPSPHIVPLSRQAKALIESLREITGGGQYLFPGERRGAMSNNTILYALYRMGYKGQMTGHGFRGLASTILHEQGWPHEHIELQLAHTPRDAVSAAYNHALYLKQRAEMMQHWADFLDAEIIRG